MPKNYDADKVTEIFIASLSRKYQSAYPDREGRPIPSYKDLPIKARNVFKQALATAIKYADRERE